MSVPVAETLLREAEVRELIQERHVIGSYVIRQPRRLYGAVVSAKHFLEFPTPDAQENINPVSYTHLTLPTTPYV